MNNYFSQESIDRKETNSSETALPVDVPSLVRSRESGDKIYFVKDGVKHWVTSPEVLDLLGFKFGDEQEIDRGVMATLQSGEPIRRENVNEYILPVDEVVEGETVEVPAQEIDNAKQEGYFTAIIPCVLTVENVSKLTEYIEKLQTYFSGEIISVVKNDIQYKDYTPKFGNKVIECEQLEEGVERAIRVARGEALVSREI